MKRAELDHIIRASAGLTDDDEIVVIGSQAILAIAPEASAELSLAMMADVFPKNRPERAGLIDGSIGKGSRFHETFGYYARGVGEETVALPLGWRHRLVLMKNTRGATGWGLDPQDLGVAKVLAGRDQDATFVEAAGRYGLLRRGQLLERLKMTDVSSELRDAARARIEQLLPE